MASNRFYIPSANEFFEGLLSLLQQCGDCVNERKKFCANCARNSACSSIGTFVHTPGGGGGVLPRILDRGVPQGFVNPNPI